MRMKYFITLILLAHNVRAEWVVEWFKRYARSIDVITVTSTNLSVRFKEAWFFVASDKRAEDGRRLHSGDYIKNNEALVLTPDSNEVCLFSHHTQIRFTPVSYKGQREGFQIAEVADHRSFGSALFTSKVTYVALSDTPMEMSEEDVEMIKVCKRDSEGNFYGGEWKAYAPPQPVPKGEAAPQTVPRNVPYLWLGLAALLCALLCTTLWLARRKRRRGTEN